MKKFLFFIFLFLFAGCAPAFSGNLNDSIAAEQGSENKYQYAAPWDENFFNNLNSQAKPIAIAEDIKGGIVPHHLVAGYMPAMFFQSLAKQKPSLVVLVSPNHFNRGNSSILTTARDWQTPFGILPNDQDLVNKLFSAGAINVDEHVIKEEHGLYGLMPLIKKNLPNTKVLSLAIKFATPTSSLDRLVTLLNNNLPADAVVVASVDFSHYQTWAVANFHDDYSRLVIKNFAFDRFKNLEVDSPGSLYVLLKYLSAQKSEKIVYETSDNSANILNRPDGKETTSYYSAYFAASGNTPSVYTEKYASFLFFGDMMLDRNVKKIVDKNGADYLFTKLAGQENRFFMGMDVVHANLEGSFANSRRATSKSIAFRFDPKLIGTLKKYNFSVFDIANNHTLDMGKAGLAESKANLDKANISYYGDGYDVSEAALLVKNYGNTKVAFLGFNDTFFPLSNSKMVGLIKKAKSQADFVVVNIHWGEEYKVFKSNVRQQSLGKLFIDAGADVIIGHHPHVTQEMEIYKNKPIFYSLGNFIFDQYFSVPTQQGLAVGVILENQKISLWLFPLQGVKSQVAQMTSQKGQEFLNNFFQKSRLGDCVFVNNNLILNQN